MKESSSDAERQNLFVNMRKRRALIFYCDVKFEYAK
jgi:hypothetical protein